MSDKIIDVAAGLILRPDGKVLLGQRPEGKPYAGYWEFPGGKVEPGEGIFAALQREFKEELGIEGLDGEPWRGVEHVAGLGEVSLLCLPDLPDACSTEPRSPPVAVALAPPPRAVLDAATQARAPRLLLHASHLAFAHPGTGAAMAFEWPADF